MASTLEGIFTAEDAAQVLGLDGSVVRKYCREGKIAAKRLGPSWAITQKELDRFRKTPRRVGNPNFRKA